MDLGNEKSSVAYMKKIMRSMIHIAGNILRSIVLYFYRSTGAEIGENTMISLGAKLDVRRGKIQIGNDCLITHGSYILSHDGAAHVIDPNDDGSGFVEIGDNVFIGVNAVVLRNVKIGDNSIVAAGAVVNKNVPEGVVVAGNPAKIIKTLDRPYLSLPKKHRVL